MTQSQFLAAVAVEETRIIREGGFYVVSGRYFAREADARFQRRLEAERRVREEARLRSICCWCEKRIEDPDNSPHVGGRVMHPGCENEFAAWINEDEAPQLAAAGGSR